MAAADVRTDDIVTIVDTVARRAPATADRVQTAIASVFTWGMRERIVTANPARGIPRRAANLPRDRVLRDCELRLVLEGLRSPRRNTSADLSMILHLLLLTGARSSEVRLAERTDLNWDGYANYKGPVWIVPGDRLHRGRRLRGRTKSGRPKVLPLSTQAAALFLQASDHAGARQRLFDVAERRAVSYAMARLCKHVGLKGGQSATPHDFRRSVSTWLGDHGEKDGRHRDDPGSGSSGRHPEALQSEPPSSSRWACAAKVGGPSGPVSLGLASGSQRQGGLK
jgi:integrase